MSDDIMAASANRPTPTPELLRCNARVIRRSGRRMTKRRVLNTIEQLSPEQGDNCASGLRPLR